MTEGLHRFYGGNDLHFLTFSCYRRRPLFRNEAYCDLVLKILERIRRRYRPTAYAPFGEPYKQAGTTDLSFTGQDQDTISGMHDFLDRRYIPVQGRWLTPDPAGLAAVDPSNPQSWNRYAYVSNNPLTLVDPFGDDCYDMNGPTGQGQAACFAAGNYWFDPSTGILTDPGNGNSVTVTVTVTVTDTSLDVATVVSVDPQSLLAQEILSNSSDPSQGNAANNGTPDKKSCAARLAAGVQKNTGMTATNLQYTGTIGGHANYTFDVSDPTGFQSILNNNPPFSLPFGIDQGYRYGVIQSTHVENTLTGGFSGHTDIFSGHSIFAPLHLLVDVGIGHIPGVNLDFGCKAGS